MSDTDLIVYQFSRLRVEHSDFSDFLDRFAPPRLPAGSRLKAMMGRMLFCIEGYDVDPREIYLIPEVRQFYAAFHSAWPYWLYFCDLSQDGLNAMVVCCLNSFASIKRDGQIRCGVEYDPLELVRFIGQDFPAHERDVRAGRSERGRDLRAHPSGVQIFSSSVWGRVIRHESKGTTGNLCN